MPSHMSECPWARHWKPSYSQWADQCLAWQLWCHLFCLALYNPFTRNFFSEKLIQIILALEKVTYAPVFVVSTAASGHLWYCTSRRFGNGYGHMACFLLFESRLSTTYVFHQNEVLVNGWFIFFFVTLLVSLIPSPNEIKSEVPTLVSCVKSYTLHDVHVW